MKVIAKRMEVIPAIDLRGGRCVRLHQGDFDRETVFSDDPLAMARQWQDQGGPRLHLVDLDGAATGQPVHLDIISAIVAALDIPVQVGGGIRSVDTARAWLRAGVQRVVIGTAAVRNPEVVSQLCREEGGDRVVVAVDARDGMVALQGWTEASEVSALELAQGMADLGVHVCSTPTSPATECCPAPTCRPTRPSLGKQEWPYWPPEGCHRWTTFASWCRRELRE